MTHPDGTVMPPSAGRGEPPGPTRLQPLLHDLVVTVAAPTVVLCAPSGDLDSRTADGGAQGLFHADVRALALARLTIGGQPPTAVLGASSGPGTAYFAGLARTHGDATPDPTVRVDRHRTVEPGSMREEIVITSTASVEVRVPVEMEFGTDLAPVDRVKGGYRFALRPPHTSPDGDLGWSGGQVEVAVGAPGARVVDGTRLRWEVVLAPRASVRLPWWVRVGERSAGVVTAGAGQVWSRPDVEADDRRLAVLVDQALDDLEGLRMATPGAADDVFVAAGAPWFLTLFGRDSLWSARMLLPLGTDLARGTLRLLAARQGSRTDPVSQEEPGKILHEVRREAFDDGHGLHLPPVYFGTVDATALWVCLLHDAWRWGMPPAEVEALLPSMEAALDWLERSAAAGGGFLRYADPSGTRLANQGWKDSGDSIRFADGALADAPVALSEVQGYAHEAAVAGAALLDAFGRAGAQRRLAWAAQLCDRFREAFWVRDDDGPYPALALDGSGRAVDAVASNMAHLLGTGLLDDEETELVARRVTAPELADGYGLRTMSTRMGGYSPLSYHCGSVWPHDTAIAVAGLARTGHGARAAGLVEGLLAASAAFDGRLPELYGGDRRADVPLPVPYPAACRPQGWSAAAAIAVLGAVLGLRPDVPAGRVDLTPIVPSPVGSLKVRGLRIAGRPLDVALGDEGHLVHARTDAEVELGRPVSGS